MLRPIRVSVQSSSKDEQTAVIRYSRARNSFAIWCISFARRTKQTRRQQHERDAGHHGPVASFSAVSARKFGLRVRELHELGDGPFLPHQQSRSYELCGLVRESYRYPGES